MKEWEITDPVRFEQYVKYLVVQDLFKKCGFWNIFWSTKWEIILKRSDLPCSMTSVTLLWKIVENSLASNSWRPFHIPCLSALQCNGMGESVHIILVLSSWCFIDIWFYFVGILFVKMSNSRKISEKLHHGATLFSLKKLITKLTACADRTSNWTYKIFDYSLKNPCLKPDESGEKLFNKRLLLLLLLLMMMIVYLIFNWNIFVSTFSDIIDSIKNNIHLGIQELSFLFIWQIWTDYDSF